MAGFSDDYRDALREAHDAALAWLDSVPERPIGPQLTPAEALTRFGGPLPDHGTDPGAVVSELARLADPGLMSMPSPRFFGWVIGGTLPAALGADWLVSAWDQNAAMRLATPAVNAAEDVAGSWILDLLGLPGDAAVAFTTGATMANFSGLAAARWHVLSEAGWNVTACGLAGGPRIRVLVGEERHASVDLALRYLGLGEPETVAADGQGRIRPDALRDALESAGDGPTIVCLQAGNLHSGAFDPMREAIGVAHRHGAWVHVDGAFGLWAAASPALRPGLDGLADADSWATDAHKTLNTPYDCGIAIVARPGSLRAALGTTADYLLQDATRADPHELVPEFSRRARGVPVWAALRSLGRSGTVALIEGLAANARALADGVSGIAGAGILNDVGFTQVCIGFGSDERTRDVAARLCAEGVAWMSASRWHDRSVLRISVSNWATDPRAVADSVEAIRRAAEQSPVV